MSESTFLAQFSRYRYTFWALLVLAILLGTGWFFSAGTNPSQGGVVETPPASDWLEVYFSDPTRDDAGSYRGGPDEALSAAIDEARYSVDVAAMDLNLWSVRDALVAAHRRGVTVRVVVDSDHFQVDEIQDLVEAGIEVVQDQRRSLMHHKFVVIDRMLVWTGSMNFTVNGAYRNDNNLIRIQSIYVARSYAHEFEEMFVEDRFGALSLADTPYPSVRVGDVDRARAGVHVAVVIETGQAGNIGSDLEKLHLAGVDMYLDGNPANMHHKVIIIDGSIVITGSYNFSRNAEEINDENVLIIYDPGLAARFLLEWGRVFAQAVPYTSE